MFVLEKLHIVPMNCIFAGPGIVGIEVVLIYGK